MTPDDLARLKALAERATPGKRVAVVRTGRNPPPPPADMVLIAAVAPGHQIFADHSGGSYPSSDMEFIAACDPSTILDLIEAASPVPAGEFMGRLRELANVSADARSLAVIADELRSEQTRDKAERMCEWREFLIAALTRSHATLLAERDAARAALLGVIIFFRGPGEDSVDHFERVASEYRRSTGRLRPGKDVPMAAADDTPMEERFRLYDEWVAGRIAAARAALAASP